MQRHERRLRVLYLTNIPAPYRVAFLNELAAYCDLTVLYERRTARDRDAAWSSRGPRRFREIHLRGVRTAADAAFCPGVLRHLRRTAFDIVVAGMYSTPTAMLAIAALRALGIPFLLSTDGGRVRPEGWARRTLKRSLISSATAWLSTGNQTSRYLTHYGAVADRIHRYPFSSVHAADVLEVPTTREVKRSRRAELGITERQCVLAVGQFIHRKGFDILIQGRLPSCRRMSASTSWGRADGGVPASPEGCRRTQRPVRRLRLGLGPAPLLRRRRRVRLANPAGQLGTGGERGDGAWPPRRDHGQVHRGPRDGGRGGQRIHRSGGRRRGVG